MTPKRQFSDEELSCYLDGEADDALATAIEQARADNPELETRLKMFEAAALSFAQDQALLLDQAPEPPMLAPVAATPATTSRKATALVACVSMLAGAVLTVGAFMAWHPEKVVDWRDVVANYQSLYVTETLTATTFTSAEQAEMLDRVGRKLGYDFGRLPNVDGYRFTRAQELGFEGRPLAQLTFLTSEQAPVALCVIKSDDAGSSELVRQDMHGLEVYSWYDGGFAVLLVGPKGDSSLPLAAAQFQAALSGSET